ncbi:FHA domain-containing protein [Dokdonella soli]|uniref:FHA domain-containing protein n=1 Tax=Dokdonella soli TaxID=529810 RepID=A0ABN1IV41_9GAMM
MKLVFPGGEHAPVDLADGVTSIGSSADCGIVLPAAAVAAHHCEIRLESGNAIARPLDAAAPTILNGRQIDRDTAIKSGDLLVFGRIGCSVSASEHRASPASATRAPPADDGRTRVRATLPRFMLRGVSGATFGKTFAVTDNAVIGRQPDCDIPVPAEEISRHHARLKLTPEGVHVEDLGSANGTYINDKRVQSGLVKPGEELRLDTVRFLLVTPGMDARQQSAAARAEVPAAAASGSTSMPWVVIGGVVLVAAVLAALHYAGVF